MAQALQVSVSLNGAPRRLGRPGCRGQDIYPGLFPKVHCCVPHFQGKLSSVQAGLATIREMYCTSFYKADHTFRMWLPNGENEGYNN